MKRFGLMAGLLAMGLCTTAIAAPPNSTRDSDATRPNRDATARESRADRDRPQTEKRGHAAPGATVRASAVIGKNIQNEMGKSVGEINDLVLDANNGRIRYAAVTYGGFLGLGDKMFAVPWEAFQCRQNPEDHDEYTVVLNVTQEQLEGAAGFDQDHWPNFADPKFTNDLDKRYRIQRRQARRQNRDVDVDVNRNGVDVDVDGQRKPER